MATLFLMVGLPGSGKTTMAKQLETEMKALRLTPDEWMGAFSFNPYDEDRRAQVESFQWDIAQKMLALGVNVILDWGFWSKAERDKYRKQANDLGVVSKVIFLPATRDELLDRLKNRSTVPSFNAVPVSEAHLDLWISLFEPPTADELK
jgi:hypothetical protein